MIYNQQRREDCYELLVSFISGKAMKNLISFLNMEKKNPQS